jgi:hypothetical protein
MNRLRQPGHARDQQPRHAAHDRGQEDQPKLVGAHHRAQRLRGVQHGLAEAARAVRALAVRAGLVLLRLGAPRLVAGIGRGWSHQRLVRRVICPLGSICNRGHRHQTRGT